VRTSNPTRKTFIVVFNPKDGGSIHLPDCTTPHPRRPQYGSSPPWEPQPDPASPGGVTPTSRCAATRRPYKS
jgi:hypothetical protein